MSVYIWNCSCTNWLLSYKKPIKVDDFAALILNPLVQERSYLFEVESFA